MSQIKAHALTPVMARRIKGLCGDRAHREYDLSARRRSEGAFMYSTWRRWTVTLSATLLVVTAGGAAAADSSAKSSDGSAVIAWNDTAATAAIGACLAPTNNPLHESRMYAMTHIAM